MNAPQTPHLVFHHSPNLSPTVPKSLRPPSIRDLPPTPKDPAGKPALYIPHTLFTGPDALHAQFHPLQAPSVFFPEFPLQRVPGLMPLDNKIPLNPRLNLLRESAYKTGSGSHTETATAVNALINFNHTKLVTVKACTSFWGNVCNYASHEGQVHAQGLPPINTWTLKRRVPLPTAEEQARAVRALAGWYLFHIHRPATMPAMTSEPSVQKEVTVQMVEPLNALLKTRYTALVPPKGHLTPKGGVTQRKAFPQWADQCVELHMDKTSVIHAAGFPDILLRCFDALNHAAVGEVKTWWSYEDVEFHNLFMSGCVSFDGVFAWDSLDLPAKLLRQLWGELHFFGCRLGFVTNGSLVMLFARTDSNTLILSVPKKWNNPNVLTALAGLSFAGVDMAYLNEEDSSQLLNEYLCPVRNRDPFWPPPSE